jgi:hypothetical protein
VLWRKVCLGAQSQAGAEFVAAALTLIMSLKSQDRSILDYCKISRTSAPEYHELRHLNTGNFGG